MPSSYHAGFTQGIPQPICATKPLRRARTIIRKTMEHGGEAGFKPLSVVVLDAGGNVMAFERSDGASAGRFQIAHAKAYGSIMLGMPGSTQTKMGADRPVFMGALAGVFNGQLLPVEGGILIRDKRGALLGAVGVTGDVSENDAAAGMAAIEAVGLTGER